MSMFHQRSESSEAAIYEWFSSSANSPPTGFGYPAKNADAPVNTASGL